MTAADFYEIFFSQFPLLRRLFHGSNSSGQFPKLGNRQGSAFRIPQISGQ